MVGQTADLNALTELFNQSLRKATLRQMSIVDLFNATAQLQGGGQRPLANELYKTWIAHNSENPLIHAVYFNYGVGLSDVRDLAGAINAFREAIRLKPDFLPPYINLGRALEDSGQGGRGVQQWLAMCQRLPDINGETVGHKLTAFHQAARVLEAGNLDAPAEDALRQSLDIDCNQPEAVQHYVSLRQRQCKWPVIAPWERVSRKALLKSISSLSLANLADDPMFQLARAYQYARYHIGTPKPMQHLPAPKAEKRKIRIGYVSSDLREHAVGFAMTDVIEQHDRENFEIYAYYCGINRTDATQQRTMKAVDHWFDINGIDDDTAAAKIKADGIDILIDLNGYTKDARTKVFARRPAPINVNWFGFPGTMGTPYHHYIIADETIIPKGDEKYFSEKVMRLPCYQPNDRKRTVSQRKPTRAEAGLPENAFVYCSLNGSQKITPRTFERWMAVLARVPNSVLWLLSAGNGVDDLLKKAAQETGVDPARLVFAGKMPNPDHLARYQLADLFLDNLPYGAHTTGADSLWMNVPILTLPGRSFAARVCASLVRAAGVPELECSSAQEYIDRAVEYAMNSEKLKAVKAKIAANRDTCTLFDTPKLARNLEELYRDMWAEYQRGELPKPDLRNLDIYHDIAVELEVENMDALSDEQYEALYYEKLAERHASYPIDRDVRMWSEEEPAAKPVAKPRRAVA
jgi:predicted O-linked N-acetylglucosamine transferase (SPINDLY family)